MVSGLTIIVGYYQCIKNVDYTLFGLSHLLMLVDSFAIRQLPLYVSISLVFQIYVSLFVQI